MYTLCMQLVVALYVCGSVYTLEQCKTLSNKAFWGVAHTVECIRRMRLTCSFGFAPLRVKRKQCFDKTFDGEKLIKQAFSRVDYQKKLSKETISFDNGCQHQLTVKKPLAVILHPYLSTVDSVLTVSLDGEKLIKQVFLRVNCKPKLSTVDNGLIPHQSD